MPPEHHRRLKKFAAQIGEEGSGEWLHRTRGLHRNWLKQIGLEHAVYLRASSAAAPGEREVQLTYESTSVCVCNCHVPR